MPCTSTTKAGKPCKAPPIKGSEHCIGHAPTERKSELGFGGYHGGGRPAKPKVVDLVREKIEADFDAWYKVLLDARDAETAVVVGNGPSARVEMVADHATRLKAFNAAFDRGFGRPKQNLDVETTERTVHSFIDDEDMVKQSRALLHAAADARRN